MKPLSSSISTFQTREASPFPAMPCRPASAGLPLEERWLREYQVLFAKSRCAGLRGIIAPDLDHRFSEVLTFDDLQQR